MQDQSEVAIVAAAFQLSLGIVFLLSTIPKLRHPLAFTQSVAGYRILPTQVVRPFSLGLVAIECALALALLSGWLTQFAVPLAVIVISTFLLAVGINLRRGRSVACGCFGEAGEQISQRTLYRLFLLLFAALCLLLLEQMGGVTLAVWPSAPANVSRLAYLLQVPALAGFLILLSLWLLNLPETLGLLQSVKRAHQSTAGQ